MLSQLFVIFATFTLFLVGLAGLIMPFIPGLPLIWLGIFIYGLGTSFVKISIAFVVWSGIIALLGMIIDFLAGLLGAKVFGASWLGVLGALLGLILGFSFFNLPGIFPGAFAGAFLAEYIQHQEGRTAAKAGAGSLLGLLLGGLLKLVLSLGLIGAFLLKILSS